MCFFAVCSFSVKGGGLRKSLSQRSFGCAQDDNPGVLRFMLTLNKQPFDSGIACFLRLSG